ncbi:unnamed protein product [Adineta steineri]|uniref:Uncharacterized protein n=1 Tax=Adineta steineri TaxID=433720 RepID=A0A819QKX8_9BILA|nr:unnamed protein product [Adineta steineri]CAF4032660.1 unnamed protein product [Adineta steineri]
MPVREEDQPILNSIERFACSIVSTVDALVPMTAIAPIERIKLLIQYQSEMLKQGIIIRPYNGFNDCIMQIFRNEG